MQLTPVTTLLKSSLQIYFKRENLIYFIKIALLSVVAPLVFVIPVIAMAGVLGFAAVGRQFSSMGVWGSGAVVLVTAIIATVLLIWMQVATFVGVVHARKGQILSIKDTLKAAWPKVGRYFFTGLAVGVVVMLGFLLLVIPGIIFAVWFSFASWFVVAEGASMLPAIQKSRALVRGFFWPVLGRFAIFFGISLVLQILARYVPVGGAIALLLFSPYFVLLHYLLFEDLKRVH